MLDKARFEVILRRLFFQGGGFLSAGASSDQKKEYIRAIFDDAFDRYGDSRQFASLEEWEEIKKTLIQNKKDILTNQDIEVLSKAMEGELT